jgi:4-diphosphocytidyl-2-C-methyl-D-erythritol kinase
MTQRAARVPAQAKINLCLRVLAREAGGHHQLETIFCRLELADEILVRTGGTGRSIDCRGADCGPTERNLAWRAAMALRDAGGPDSFAIEIEKRIPVGGGLGGGSADAGAVLRALNALSNRPLRPERLLSLAVSLGADVPFATATHPLALAWGRGERMLELDPPPPAAVLLAVPPFAVSTAEAYGWLAAERGDVVPEARSFTRAELATWPSLATLAENAFEPPVERRHPRLTELRQAFRAAGARLALLAGSGSTVFGVFDDAAAADRVAPAPFAARDAKLLRTATATSVAGVALE